MQCSDFQDLLTILRRCCVSNGVEGTQGLAHGDCLSHGWVCVIGRPTIVQSLSQCCQCLLSLVVCSMRSALAGCMKLLVDAYCGCGCGMGVARGQALCGNEVGELE